MRRRSLSARLERHMERGEELMELNRRELELNRATAERNTQAFERLMTAFDRHEKAFERHQREFEQVPAALDAQDAREDDLKTFIREINLRSERRFQEWRRRNDELDAERRARSDTLLAELRQTGKEARDESRAVREALFVLIDRLPPPAEAA